MDRTLPQFVDTDANASLRLAEVDPATGGRATPRVQAPSTTLRSTRLIVDGLVARIRAEFAGILDTPPANMPNSLSSPDAN